MDNFSKDFYEGNEVLFVGYSGKNQGFSKMIYQAFTDNGIKVYPMNSKDGATYDVKVYKNFEELPQKPKTAFLLLNKENTRKVIQGLADNGIKKIQFQTKGNVDNAILEQCKNLGIKTIVACPMARFGKGLHRFHGYLAGVR